MISVVVLLSGHGSNLQALIDACQHLPASIVAVVANRPNAYGLTRAQQNNIPAHCIDSTLFENRDAFDLALQQHIDTYHPDYILLAGFMRRLGCQFTNHFRGRLLNIHPSLLPKYPGLKTHEKVLAAQDTYHGCTIHYVTPVIDAGPIIFQASCPVRSQDTLASLRERVQQLEHKSYPRVLHMLCEGRLTLNKSTVFFDNEPLTYPLTLKL